MGPVRAKVRRGLVHEVDSGRRAYPMATADPTPGLMDRSCDAGPHWVYWQVPRNPENTGPSAAEGLLEGLERGCASFLQEMP